MKDMSIEKALEGARLAFDYGYELLEDAEFLADAGRSGSMGLLTLFAIEELGKSEILQYYAWEKNRGYRPALKDYDVALGDMREIDDGVARSKLKGRKKRVRRQRGAMNNGILRDPVEASRRDHNLKLQQFINWMNLSVTTHDYFGEEYARERGLVYRGSYCELTGVQLESLRESQAYVNFDSEKADWQSPLASPTKMMQEILALARQYSIWVETCLQKRYFYWEINADIGKAESSQYVSAFEP